MHTSYHIHIFIFIKSNRNIKGAAGQTWQLEFSKLMLVLTAVKVLAGAHHWHMLSSFG